ncbi:hypothetical protein [Butyrivibrio sp. XPD2002]|uniref:hypothetical protein n=1 Tax=Butyrivibrio sp. XPD2002 TaxID=1280665 RepID=UPI000404F381|nr:hypothetical protein [Butyrivibrio sp. XPD2002]
MVKISKIGAAAIALALSITLITPMSAKAEIIKTYEKDGSITLKNEDTGRSFNTKDFVADEAIDEDYIEEQLEIMATSETKAITITTNSKNEGIGIITTCDVAKCKNFKANKKALKVKIIQKDEYTDTSTTKKNDYDIKGKDGLYYYRNLDGEIVKKELKDCPKGVDYGIYAIRLYTEKAGTYKVTYEAVLKDGTTAKRSFKVIAVADSAAFKSITYAGKVLAYSVKTKDAPENRVWSQGYGYGATTSKSGKIQVTMNENFKLKKIEVGKEVYKEIPGTKDVSTKAYADGDYTSSLERYNEKTISWKKVKNGKKIKLNKEDNTDKHDYWVGHEYKDKGTYSTTYIRVTYYDKKNKTTERYVVPIYLVKK